MKQPNDFVQNVGDGKKLKKNLRFSQLYQEGLLHLLGLNLSFKNDHTSTPTTVSTLWTFKSDTE